ncbi:MAG: hypothetical protein ISS50_03405 [Anaerolineae bacterium]|nr:hypothetical protein [Anaerolineae bacterium]
MPVITFPEYACAIQDVLDAVAATGEANVVNVRKDQRSLLRGFIAGMLQFNDGSELHFREFVNVGLPEPRLMYAYHYQDVNRMLILRYDNAAHRPPLPQAEHKHTPAGVEVSFAPTLAQVIDEILRGG